LAVWLVVTATACMSHADAHAHALHHPLLCLDAPGAIAEGHTLLRQLMLSRPLQSFLKYSALMALTPGMPLLHVVEQKAQYVSLVWPLSDIPRQSLRALLAVLHL